jgi:hypothetical protein
LILQGQAAHNQVKEVAKHLVVVQKIATGMVHAADLQTDIVLTIHVQVLNVQQAKHA